MIFLLGLCLVASHGRSRAGSVPLVRCFRVLCVDDFSLFHIRVSRASSGPSVSATVRLTTRATLWALSAAIQLLRQPVCNTLEVIYGNPNRRHVVVVCRS